MQTYSTPARLVRVFFSSFQLILTILVLCFITGSHSQEVSILLKIYILELLSGIR